MTYTKQERLLHALVKRFEKCRKQAAQIYSSQDKLNRLQEMQQLAQIRGGVCLSKHYVDHEAKLRFRCAEGHEWGAVPSSIRRGTWCRICGSKRAGRSKALTIEIMCRIAAKRGGECLSKAYENNLTKLRWRCKEGHEWETVPASILRGSWCRICAGILPKDLALQELQKLAVRRGGVLLSKRYKRSQSHLLWQCAKGHKWKAVPSAIKAGTWCPVCGGSFPLNIRLMQDAARVYGGRCLSKKYININTHLRWSCLEGHEWDAKPYHVMTGHWCPICSSGISERICRALLERVTGAPFPKMRPRWLRNDRGRQMELDGYAEPLRLAFEYQGVQHYEPIPFLDPNGLRFRQRQQDDRRKRQLCSQNGVTLLEIPYHIPHHKLHEHLLAKLNRVNRRLILDDKPIKIEHLGVWKRKYLEEMQKIAKARGGKLLSKFYINSQTKLRWRCSKGHIWEAVPTSIKAGSWCRICSFKIIAAKKRIHTIEEMRALAKAKGGLCLSANYVSFESKLRWRCAKGHGWETPPSSVLSGHWCPICAGKRPKPRPTKP